MSTVALIAASGGLPAVFADELCRRGHEIVAVGIVPAVDARVRQAARCFEEISPGRLQRAIDICNEHSATAAVFAGKFEKSVFCAGMEFDDRLKQVLSRVKGGGDNLSSAVAENFESEGIEISQLELGRIPAHAITDRSPSSDQMRDVFLGLDGLETSGIWTSASL